MTINVYIRYDSCCTRKKSTDTAVPSTSSRCMQSGRFDDSFGLNYWYEFIELNIQTNSCFDCRSKNKTTRSPNLMSWLARKARPSEIYGVFVGAPRNKLITFRVSYRTWWKYDIIVWYDDYKIPYPEFRIFRIPYISIRIIALIDAYNM